MATRKKAEADAKQESNKISKEETALRNSLRSKADRIVLDRHREEVNAEASRLFAEQGLEYKRRLTPEEKREQEFLDMVSNNPALAAKYGVQLPSEGGEEHAGNLDLTHTGGIGD